MVDVIIDEVEAAKEQCVIDVADAMEKVIDSVMVLHGADPEGYTIIMAGIRMAIFAISARYGRCAWKTLLAMLGEG